MRSKIGINNVPGSPKYKKTVALQETDAYLEQIAEETL